MTFPFHNHLNNIHSHNYTYKCTHLHTHKHIYLFTYIHRYLLTRFHTNDIHRPTYLLTLETTYMHACKYHLYMHMIGNVWMNCPSGEMARVNGGENIRGMIRGSVHMPTFSYRLNSGNCSNNDIYEIFIK